MGFNFNTIPIEEVLLANEMYNSGLINFYKTIGIQESDFNKLSINSVIEFDSFLHPFKKEFEKSKVNNLMNYLPCLHPEIQAKKESLLKLLGTLFENRVKKDDKVNEDTFNELDYFGILSYKQFISNHFDLILDAIKSHFQWIHARYTLDLIEEHNIQLNFLGFYLLSRSYFSLNDREQDFSKPNRDG